MKTKILPTERLSNINFVRKLNVPPTEVVLFKADVNYTEVVLTSGERIVISKTLKALEQHLEKRTTFVRTHKSYIVNLNHVLSYQLHEGMTIRLTNNETAIISRRRKDDFLLNVREFEGR